MTLYYAKRGCTIDGRAFNAGEVVPESYLQGGDRVMHLVRKEGEPLNDEPKEEKKADKEPTPSATGEGEGKLPTPDETSEKDKDTKEPAGKDAPSTDGPEDTQDDPKKDEKKDTKDTKDSKKS